METINIERYSVAELDRNEAYDIRGGFLPLAVAATILVSMIQNFGDIRHGLQDGWNGTPRY
ncbi:MAG TPA: hypothetical protein VK666_30905 [Chryseolinea sp.]|nr:hypothetical protein [Chryseolinea sp.]